MEVFTCSGIHTLVCVKRWSLYGGLHMQWNTYTLCGGCGYGLYREVVLQRRCSMCGGIHRVDVE